MDTATLHAECRVNDFGIQALVKLSNLLAMQAEGYLIPDGTLIVSSYRPMRSNAGWYIGQACYEYDAKTSGESGAPHGWYGPMPYDRASGYYLTEEEAQADLDSWEM